MFAILSVSQCVDIDVMDEFIYPCINDREVVLIKKKLFCEYKPAYAQNQDWLDKTREIK